MNPMDVKRKALQAVKGYGREGLGEHLKQGYMKPAVAIEIKSVKAMPEHGGMDEEAEGEGMMPPKKLAMHEGMEPEGVKKAEGEYGEEDMGEGEHEMPDGSMMADSAMKKGKPEITPELLEMLLEKLGK
jgi:hypothetical protein